MTNTFILFISWKVRPLLGNVSLTSYFPDKQNNILKTTNKAKQCKGPFSRCIMPFKHPLLFIITMAENYAPPDCNNVTLTT